MIYFVTIERDLKSFFVGRTI